jgi:hypothetical protein
MPKKRISTQLAVADIRSGMNDAALMKKYGLASDGLQSLFDKLVTGGYIDLSEVQGRMQGFWGTIIIDDLYKETALPKAKSGARINAQEAARDVRSGMDDPALMEKYRLSHKGLQSLFDKLIAGGLITQADLNRRSFGIEHTVDLREELPSLSQVLRHLGQPSPFKPAEPEQPKQPEPPKIEAVVESKPEGPIDFDKIDDKEIHDVEDDGRPQAIRTRWFDKPALIALLLIVLFPVGFYGLYKNSTFSILTKVAIILIWTLLAIIGALAVIPDPWQGYPESLKLMQHLIPINRVLVGAF